MITKITSTLAATMAGEPRGLQGQLPPPAGGKVCFPLTEYIVGGRTQDSITTKTRITAEEGAFGEIWQACQNGGCRYILKYQPFRPEDKIRDLPAITSESITKEAILQDELAKFKLAPPVKDSWMCTKGGAIVMPALKQTVYVLIREYTDPDVHYLILARCLGLIQRLHSHGYYHGDASISNIMITYDEEDLVDAMEEDTEMKRYLAMNYRYYFIDMGFSGRLSEVPSRSEVERKDYEVLAMSLQVKMDDDVLSEDVRDQFGRLVGFVSAYLR